MLKFGIISEVDEQHGQFRVQFDDQEIVSGWLPGLVKNSFANKDETWFDINEHVVCLVDENLEHGVVLGSIYSESEEPLIKNKDVRSITFSDGTFLKYDRSAKKLTVSVEGDIEIIKSNNITAVSSGLIKLDSPQVEITGKLQVNDSVDVTNDLTVSAGDLITSVGDVKAGPLAVSLMTHIHSGVTTGAGVTGPPS